MNQEFQYLLTVVKQIQPLTKEAEKDLESLCEIKHLKNNEMLLEEGKRAFDCYFLIKGIIRVFYSKDGSEYNKNFFISGMFPTAISSLISEKSSKFSYQALEECLLIKFSYLQFRKLFEKHRCLESMLLRIMEIEWIKKEQHDVSMVMNQAKDNYLLMREKFPGIEQQIPQYHIASYLGITPIQLSRIRKDLFSQK